MQRHERQIKRAMSVAKTSQQRWAHGAVVAIGNKVVSFAPNKFRNLSSIDYLNATYHAEDAALREVKDVNLRRAAVYIARVGKRGDSRMARPCARCMKLIVEAGIREIIYTNDSGGISIEKFRPFSIERIENS